MQELLRQLKEIYRTGDDMICPVRFFSYDPVTMKVAKVIELRNLIVYSGADILAQLLAGNNQFKPGAMYMEFKNTGGTPVTPPSYNRTNGTLYYQTLPSDVDILRIPLIVTPAISKSSDNYQGNQVTFFGTTQGVAGLKHGLAFNTNSVVYGAALVATPKLDDDTQDLVFSRVYTEIGSIQKAAGHQIGVTWTIQCD